MAEDFPNMERYVLQPKKTEALKVQPTRNKQHNNEVYQIYSNNIANVESSTHLELKRATTIELTSEQNVERNIQKARRTLYSFITVGMHGSSGLDIQSILHLIQVYVTPVLLYGLEVILPKKVLLDKLNIFQKRILKQLLALPTNTADAAIYMFTGFLPIEAQLHKRALTLFNNVCLQSEDSVETRLARTQLCVKTSKSSSWYVEVARYMCIYDLGNPETLLDEPMGKSACRNQVNKAVDKVWVDQILTKASGSRSMMHVNQTVHKPGKSHPLLHIEATSPYDANRTILKLKFMAGTYILQTNRAACNQNAVDPTCLLCKNEPETLEHFILNCETLSVIRGPIIRDIEYEVNRIHDKNWASLSGWEKVHVIIDCTHLLTVSVIRMRDTRKLIDLELH